MFYKSKLYWMYKLYYKIYYKNLCFFFTVHYLNDMFMFWTIMKNDPDQFNVLRKINSNPNLSQRDLANELNLSLGKINYCLKALKSKGLVKIQNFNKSKNKMGYAYILTPRGISEKTKITINFMKRKMKEYEELKKEINQKK